MPRKDKTFSSRDVIRIFDLNLTVAEQRIVKAYICDAEVEEVEDLEKWPPELCYPMFELLEMVEFAIDVSIDLWDMSRLTVTVTEGLLQLATSLSWLPLFGDILLRDFTALHEKVLRFDASTLKRFERLREYFALVNTYTSEKCYGRPY